MTTSCTGCGRDPGEGRLCAHCGRPLGDRGAGRAAAPLPVVSAPSTPRYPLYADQPLHGPPGPPPAEPPRAGATYAPPPGPPAGPAVPPAAPRHSTRRAPWLLWASVAAVLLLVAGLGTFLALGPGTGDDAGPAPAAATPAGPSDTADTAEPGADAPSSGDETVAAGERRDVARDAQAEVPRTAPPSTDLRGNVTRYTADHLLDGVETTCWRMPGDGTGSEIVLTLAEPTAISAVGLVNGYAKTVGSGRRAVDWYAANRRVQVVEWRFDDGTTVRQDLARDRSLQAIEIGPVTTSTVTLALIEVSAPGKGRTRRDFTAISDVALVGVPV